MLSNGASSNADPTPLAPAKRRAGDIPIPDALTHSDLMSELDSFGDQLSDKISANVRATIVPEVISKTKEIVARLDEKIESRCGAVDNRLNLMQQEHAQLKAAMESISNRQSRVETHLQASSSADAAVDDMRLEDWERGPIGHLLCVNAEDDVTLDAVQATIDSWFAAKSVPANAATLHGPALGKHFKLYFNGDAGFGTRMAKKTNLSLRGQGNNWEKLYCQSPSSAQVRLFISPDKAPKPKAAETMCKRVVKEILRTHPSLKCSINRHHWAILAGDLPIAKAAVDDPNNLHLDVDEENCEQLAISPASLRLATKPPSDAAILGANWRS